MSFIGRVRRASGTDDAEASEAQGFPAAGGDCSEAAIGLVRGGRARHVGVDAQGGGVAVHGLRNAALLHQRGRHVVVGVREARLQRQRRLRRPGPPPSPSRPHQLGHSHLRCTLMVWCCVRWIARRSRSFSRQRVAVANTDGLMNTRQLIEDRDSMDCKDWDVSVCTVLASLPFNATNADCLCANVLVLIASR